MSAAPHGTKAVDTIQQALTDYATKLRYEDLSPEAVHAAKVRVIDTRGCLIGAFFGEPARISRALAAQHPQPQGATVIGTRLKTMLDMAPYANETAARA